MVVWEIQNNFGSQMSAMGELIDMYITEVPIASKVYDEVVQSENVL